MKIPYKKTRNGITIMVKVQPRSSRKGLVVIGDIVKVNLTAPPVEGAANEQLVEVLSEELGVRKSAIRIVKGMSSRNKVIEVEGIEEP